MDNTKIKISIPNNEVATSFVNTLAKYGSRNFMLTSGNGKECVDAKSYLGVAYFMVIHPNDTYLLCEDSFEWTEEILKFKA